MEIVFAVAVLTTVFYHGAKAVLRDVGDLHYAVKGKDSPRWAYKQAKLEAARKGEPTGYWQVLAARAWKQAFAKQAETAARPVPAERGPQPLRDFGRRCWADAWETQGIAHDKRVAARRQKRAAKDSGGVEAPVDAELTPQALDVPDSTDGVNIVSTVVHDHPTSVPFEAEFPSTTDEAGGQSPSPVDQGGGAVEQAEAPVDHAAVPTASTKPADSKVVGEQQPWSPTGHRPEELERLRLARRRARAYLYGEGLSTTDRKPDSEDAAVLLNGLTDEDRALGNAVLDHSPDLEERWQNELQRRSYNDMVARGLIDRDGTPRSTSRPDQAADDPNHNEEGITDYDHSDPVPDNVIPFNKPLPTPKEIEPMTTATTEIDGLETAISWATDVKTNAAEMASGIDDVEGDFAARKVTGETLTLVGQIGEAYDELRNLAEQLEQKLQNMQSVAEAYEASPDAGDKEFVTS